MNFNQLKYFLTVCEFGTVSAAAEYLHIAQPSLSIAIKELESEFGTVLFNRKHKGMVLTHEGELFLNMAKDILERVDTAEKTMKDMGHNKKTLKLGVPPMIGSLILPAIYNGFLSTNEDISLEIAEYGREEMCKKISEGRLDMAFISHNRISDFDLELLPVGSLEIVCSTAPFNSISKKSSVSPTQLSGKPLVMFKDGFFQSAEINNWFSREGIQPHVLMKTDQLSTMVKLISSNTAVGFLFQRLVENEGEITAVPLEPPITVNISLAWKNNKIFSSGMKRFKGFIENNEIFK